MHNNKLLKKKGMIFTIDAILALIIAGIIILAAFFFLSKVNTQPHDQQALHMLASDSLSVLEKIEILKESVETSNTTKLNKFINDTFPYQTCAEIKIYNQLTKRLLNSTREGCTIKNESSFARRVFIANNSQTYYAVMEVSYR